MAALVPAHGATIELSKGQLKRLHTVPGNTPIPEDFVPRILISGEIVAGDERKLANVLAEADQFLASQKPAPENGNFRWAADTVWLDSNGGNISTAMTMARLIRAHHLSTLVADQAVCASACVLVLAGGVSRMGRAEAAIGLHRPQFANPAEATGKGFDEFNARYSAAVEVHRKFLLEMNIPPAVLNAILAVPSNEIRWISVKEAEAMSLLGSDPVYAEWRRSKRTADLGREYMQWEDRYLKCLSTRGWEVDCTKVVGPEPPKRPMSQ